MGFFGKKEKIHLISWKKIAKPKKDGGLGIQAVRVKNVALLAKLNWRLHSEPSSLWAKVLTQKYRSPRRVANPCIKSRTCSSTWSAIRKGVFLKRAPYGMWAATVSCPFGMTSGWIKDPFGV